jgi:hypothetical protein
VRTIETTEANVPKAITATFLPLAVNLLAIRLEYYF